MIGTSSTTVDGWTLDVTHGTAFPPIPFPLPSIPYGDFSLLKCTGNDFWFGLKHGSSNLASIKTTLKGCGKAMLDYGNCYSCTGPCPVQYVHVTLNGNEISKAAYNGLELSKTVDFDFKDGDILELYEAGKSAIKFNGFTIIKCCTS